MMQLLISQNVLHFIILAALAMAGLGLVTLIVLLIRDSRNRSIW